jgi:phage-related protein
MIRTKTFAAAAAMTFALSMTGPAHADIFGDIAKAVGNVLTGGLLGLAEGAAKAAQGKAKPGDILNIATGGVAGAIQSAAKIGQTVHQGVHAAIAGVGKVVSGVLGQIGVALPALPKLPLPGNIAAVPAQVMQAFGKAFSSALPGAFGAVAKPAPLRPGAGLFTAGQQAVARAIERARTEALAKAKALGLPVPNLGGIASFLTSKVQSAFSLARNVALGKAQRVVGQFAGLVPATAVRQAVTSAVTVFQKAKAVVVAAPPARPGAVVVPARPVVVPPPAVKR